jgi:signal transduction histidine kinase
VLVECDAGLEARGDPILLEQALASLAANAVQHTAEGSVTIRAAENGTAVAISIADTGVGIPAATRDKIFERFYQGTGDGNGFGLGLSVARDAVRVLGGEIDVTSTEGRGTTVEIRLPQAARVPA